MLEYYLVVSALLLLLTVYGLDLPPLLADPLPAPLPLPRRLRESS